MNPEASCLIMTTEILRSMLYRGATLLQDVEFVIFDEVHYINDQDRGVVWEEVIIMLPPHITVIMLSATTPNNLEFADWVGRTRQYPIYVISTLKRPVPLEHFIFTNRSVPVKKELYKIVDGGRVFNEVAYRKALQSLQNAKEREQASLGTSVRKPQLTHQSTTQNFRNVNQERNLWTDVVYFLQKQDLLPVVAFTFSKRKCDENADNLENLNLNSASEKSAVIVFMQNCVSKLQGDDAMLPQILWLQGLLIRGIAVHHSGLLPLMKEAVEILFSRGLVKILFATETFAMGVNMPARTVVFSSLRKHDGNEFRYLHAGEYTQMAGRAGRRGKDPTGTVIILSPEGILSDTILRQIILGQPTRLISQFRLTYQMILSLLRIESLRVEEMLKKSFSEDRNQKLAPEQAAALADEQKLLEGLEKLQCPICSIDLEFYYAKCRSIREKSDRIFNELLNGSQRLGTKIISIGTILIVDVPNFNSVPGIVLKISSSKEKDETSQLLIGIPDVFLKSNDKTEISFPPWHVNLLSTREIVKSKTIKSFPISHTNIVKITQTKLKIPPDCLTLGGQVNLKDIPGILAEYSNACNDETLVSEAKFPQFSSTSGGFEFDELVILRRQELQSLPSHTCHSCPDLFIHYTQIHRKSLLTDRLAVLQFQLSDESLHLLPEYENRIKVLTELGYLDAGHTVQIKGRVACEINTVDPLILTELLFENAFGDLSPSECAAFLAGLVFQDRSSLGTTGVPYWGIGKKPENIEVILQRLLLEDSKVETDADIEDGDNTENDNDIDNIILSDTENALNVDDVTVNGIVFTPPILTKNYLIDVTPGIYKTVKRLVKLTSSLAALQRSKNLGHLPCGTAQSYLKSLFNPALIRTVYEWTRGTSFLNLTTQFTTIPEGSIVRCITRLDETCREAAGAGKIMGDPGLVAKMEEAARLIRRDICFTSSLYL